MIEIPLTQGYVAIVDDEEAWLTQHRWAILKCKSGKLYARRSVIVDGKRKSLLMHRAIAEHIENRVLARNDEVDHEDLNGLNNQRRNLRVCNHTQNLQNKKLKVNSKSGFKGVWRTSSKKNPWVSAITVFGEYIYLGVHPTKEAAFAAYCDAGRKYFGEFFRAA